MTKYYNALNLLYKGDYSKLKKVWERFQNWEKAWDKESDANINPEKEFGELQNKKISLMLKEDENYPPLLKEIPLPPFGIYILGKLNYNQPAIAIVGTRTATPQGKELSKTFAQKLGVNGITVISGLAMGIDEYAHRGALESNGKTVAVLGTPLNYIYPKCNERLAKTILEKNGAIISEFPSNQEYHPQNFLIRNRIISGLTDAVLVIEAPERSGALATARFALEQNREIFVIPGNIAATNYRGSNTLIKAGATPVTDAQDILDYFGIANVPKQTAAGLFSGNENEKIIVNAFKGKEEQLTTEELIKLTKLDIGQFNKSLAVLVIRGIIKEINGKYTL